MPLIDPSIWFSLTDAAAFLGLTKTRVSVLVREGRIPHERVGRMVYIRRDDAAAFKAIPRQSGKPRAQPKSVKKRKK